MRENFWNERTKEVCLISLFSHREPMWKLGFDDYSFGFPKLQIVFQYLTESDHSKKEIQIMAKSITRKNVGYFGCLYAEYLKKTTRKHMNSSSPEMIMWVFWQSTMSTATCTWHCCWIRSEMTQAFALGENCRKAFNRIFMIMSLRRRKNMSLKNWSISWQKPAGCPPKWPSATMAGDTYSWTLQGILEYCLHFWYN